MGYNLSKNGICWGEITPLILTIDPNKPNGCHQAGDEDAQKFAKQLLDCAVLQKGEALASLVPKFLGRFRWGMEKKPCGVRGERLTR